VTATPPTFEYETLRDSLAHSGAIVELAELHGGVCGALCGGGPPAAERWLDDCFKDQDVTMAEDVQAPLREIVGVSWRTLDGKDLAFEPLLPDDESPLDEQVQALGLWCHGFLGGLGASAPDVARGPVLKRRTDTAASPVAIDEIVADFSEISRVGLSDDDTVDRNQADFALAELKEYVRVSVQIVFDDLLARRAAAARDVH
jgi:hypothetical protein